MKTKLIYMKNLIKPATAEEYIIFNPNYTLDEMDNNNKLIIDIDKFYEKVINDIMSTYNRFRMDSDNSNVCVYTQIIERNRIQIIVKATHTYRSSKDINDFIMIGPIKYKWILNFKNVDNASEDMELYNNFIMRLLP